MGSKNGKPVLRDTDVEYLTVTSGLSEDEVKQHFDSFVGEHENGKIKKKQFSEMMDLALPGKESKKMEKHIFRVYDANDDGVIDFVEFMVVYHVMSDGTPEEVLGKIFRVFDLNSDGTITKKEMTRLVKDMMGLIKEENPEEESEKLIANSAFAEMDTDEDGKVTTDEFTTACLAHEKFSQMLALKVVDIFIEEPAAECEITVESVEEEEPTNED